MSSFVAETNNVVNGNKEEAEEEEEDEEIFYDKSKSFFDNISCEATERAKGYVHQWMLMLIWEMLR